MTVKHLYPDVEPSLNLDFANIKRLDPRITFSRSSTATYVGSDGLIKTAPINGARFDHDPETGDSLGLLIEESRTNLLTYSEQFDNAAWAKDTCTAPSVSVTNPAGGSLANALTDNSTLNRHMISQGTSYTSGVSYTFSAYAKANTLSRIMLYEFLSNKGVGFDLATGSIFTVNGVALPSGTYSIQKADGGWYRCSLTFTASSTGAAAVAGIYTISGSDFGYSGSGQSVYIWGAQLEAGSFPTSYIPTAGATVTRAADVAQITGANFSSWYNQSASTVYAESRFYGATIPGQYGTVWSLSAGVFNNSFLGRFQNGAGFISANDNDSLLLTYAQTGATGPLYKTAASYGQSGNTVNKSLAMNGISAAGTPATTAYTAHDQLGLGKSWNNAFRLSGTISRLAYYPVRLPDATLQAITL